MTVVAEDRVVGDEPPSARLRSLLDCARCLVLAPSTDRSAFARPASDYRSWVGHQAQVVMLHTAPKVACPETKPSEWLQLALQSIGYLPGATARDAVVLLTHRGSVFVPDPGEPMNAVKLCNLEQADFASAWNRHLSRTASAVHAQRTTSVVASDPSLGQAQTGEAESRSNSQRVAELELLVRELDHERNVLRQNRDLARTEHLEELRAHRAVSEAAQIQIEGYERELKLRAETLGKLYAAIAEHERERDLAHENQLAEREAHRELVEVARSQIECYEVELGIRNTVLTQLDIAIARDGLEQSLMRAEYDAQLREHRKVAAELKSELHNYEKALKARAGETDKLYAVIAEHEQALRAYSNHVGSLEELVHRTGA